MELLPKSLRFRLPRFSALQDDKEPYVFARYELKAMGLEWYVIAGQPEESDFAFYGYIPSLSEFGYFSLSELEAMRAPSGQGVELDDSFVEGGLTDRVPAPE